VSDLFSAAAEEQLRSQSPLAARLRPRTIDDVVGQEHLVGVGKPLRRLVEQDKLSSAIFWGPPGTGKTTLALAVAGTTKRAFEQLSAVTAGVKDVREVIERARQRLGMHAQGTILFLDEIHRFSKSQQDALLPAVEDGTLTLIGATTENPFFEVNAPLRSRSTLFRLEPLSRDAIRTLIERGLIALATTATPDAVDLLSERSGGDGRQVLTSLEVASALSHPDQVLVEHVEAALGTSALRYGRDDHYDVVSAFIKSLRGSDPQAATYYLARMLEAGEDARFIVRRMVIFASEDIGLADPTALMIAVAAAHALEHVGLPEAELNLAHAPTSKMVLSAKYLHICAMPTIKGLPPLDMARDTTTLMMTRVVGFLSNICPMNSSLSVGTNQVNTDVNERSLNVWHNTKTTRIRRNHDSWRFGHRSRRGTAVDRFRRAHCRIAQGS
jgi:putative ATPase